MTDWKLRTLVGGRFVVGGGALLLPRLTCRVFGLEPTPALVFVGRMFGVRAVGMGVAVASSDGMERERQIRGGVAVDLVDALAAVALARGHRRTAAIAFAAAVSEAALGMALLSTREAVRVRTAHQVR